VNKYDTNRRCWTCGSEQQTLPACPSKTTSTVVVNSPSSTVSDSNQNNTNACVVKMITCVTKSVSSVETQTMAVMAESVSSHTNSVSMCVNTDSRKPTKYRNFCRKIETVSNNSQKHVSVCVDQNEVQNTQIYA